MIVGSRIKDLRIGQNLSQQQLGDLLGVSKVSICGYENGSRIPSLDIFNAMINIFGVSADYLLGREVSVVGEEESDYLAHLSKEEVTLVRELRKFPVLYSKLMKDTTRYLSLISKKLK